MNQRPLYSCLSRLACGISVAVAGCGGGDTPAPTNQITVKSGGSIQAAVDAAKDGYTILVEPGLYHESIDVAKERALKKLTLRGMISGSDRAVLDGEGQRQNGMFFAGVAGVTVEGFAVKNFKENGIWFGQSSDIVVRNVVVEATGKYGIFPQEAVNATVEKSSVTRCADAGIYVGQSMGQLLVQDNEVFGNVAGIECENSLDCMIRRNHSYNNTNGVLVFTLPHLVRKDCKRAQITDNTIENNNTANFANSHDIVFNVPPGGGVTIIGATDVLVSKNVIRGNSSYAAAIVSLKELTGTDPIDVDPLPQNDRVTDNTVSGNGTVDFMFLNQKFTAGDFAYDATGSGDCQANNGIAAPRWVLAPLDTCK